MSHEENKQLVRRFLDEVCGGPKPPELVQRYVDNVDLIEHIAAWEVAFPHYQLFVEDMVAEGDTVALRVTFHGTHRAAFAGIPPTGRTVSTDGMIFYRIREAKIVEHWITADTQSLIQQLT